MADEALVWKLTAGAMDPAGWEVGMSSSGWQLSRHPNRMMRFPLSRQNSRVGCHSLIGGMTQTIVLVDHTIE